MREFFAAVLAAAAFHAHADSCVWYADDDSIRQVQTSSNQVTRVVALRNPHRLVMNSDDCGVWTLDKHDRKLLRFNADGALERLIDVRGLGAGLEEVERFRLDPFDASLWITDDRRIARVSPEGHLLGQFLAPGEVRRLAVALDQTLWVLGKRDLWRFDAKGTLLATHTLGRHLAGDARYFAVDSVAGLIWLADDNDLAQLKLADPAAEPPLRIRLPHHVSGFALDPLSGNAWVAQSNDVLLAFSRTGALAHRIELEPLNIRRPEKLGFDPVSRSLWAGAERSVSRFTDTGQFVVRFSARDGDEALGVPAFKVQPVLTLVRPPRDALTNNPQPEFRLGYGAECNSSACPFPSNQFSGYQLSATLNDQQVANSFIFDPGSAEASFTPATRLPEGQNSFSAQVKDGFGHSSNSVSSVFTIDTVAPQFLTLVPADGAIFQVSAAALQGTIDDPTATVVLEGRGATQIGPNFTFPIVLQPGANVFRISAIDRAGNATSAQRTLNFIPLSVSITSPIAGTTVFGSTVQVTGTIQGPANTGVAVNGVVAAIVGDRFYASVPLQAGANTLTAVAKTADGFTALQSVSVHSNGPAAIEAIPTRLSGLGPLEVTFELTASAGSSIRRVEADFDGNGTVDLTVVDPKAPITFTYPQPGIFPARLVLVDGLGNTTTQIFQIVVHSAAAVDQQVRAVWSGFATALVERNTQRAQQYLSDSAREIYAPVLEALRDRLPTIAAGFSEPRTVSITSTLAEYAIRRTESNGKAYLYLVYFTQGSDGIWRLESM